MLRSSEDLRGARLTAKKKNVLPAQKKVLEEPVPEELSAAAAPAVVRTDLGTYQCLVKVTEEVFAADRPGPPPEESTIISILLACMGKLREGEALLVETMRQHQSVPDLAERGANSAILSMRLAMGIEADDKRCLAVGHCGLLHDLGMLKVSEEAIRGRRPDEAGIESLKRHPIESQRILEDFGPVFAWVGRIVVQVHEIAQLVGLADTYLAMATRAPAARRWSFTTC